MQERWINIGEKTHFADGLKIEAEIKDPLKKRNPSSTAKHEIIHGLLDYNNVASITMDPTEEYEAATFFKSVPNAEAMAGPDAFHMQGTSFDVHQLELRGESLSAARMRAITKMAELEKYLDPAAGVLEARRNISGRELIDVMRRVDEGNTVRIKITKPDGSTEVVEQTGVDINASSLSFTMEEGNEYELLGDDEESEVEEDSNEAPQNNNLLRFPIYPKSPHEVS